MTTCNATVARARLCALVSRASPGREPITITGAHGNAALVSDDDWRSVQETLYLLSVPGMRESSRDGLADPVEACTEEPGR